MAFSNSRRTGNSTQGLSLELKLMHTELFLVSLTGYVVFSIPFLSSYQKRPAEINTQATVLNTKIPVSLEAATAQK